MVRLSVDEAAADGATDGVEGAESSNVIEELEEATAEKDRGEEAAAETGENRCQENDCSNGSGF